MASKVLSALEMARPGMSRLRAGQGGMNYQAATIYQEQPKSSLLDSLGRFAKAGADMYQAAEQRKKDLADERSNEIIRKLTPEQRREALNNGTLLYQDDPYAMEALRVKSGRNAAYLVDDDVMQKVKNGEFRTRQEMEEYRHSRLQEGAKSYAEQFGLDPEDVDYQRGFNADITERNISLYGAHDNFLSDQAKKGAIVNSKVELNSVLSDPDMLKRPDSAEFFGKYIDNALTIGSIPSDDQAVQLIGSALSDVTNRPGGADFLMRIESQKVKLHGAESTYRELLGEEQWNAMMVTAQRSQFDHDAKLTEKFQLNVNNALNQDDPRIGWEMIQGIKAEMDKLQPGEQLTPQRQLLIQAEQNLQNAMVQWTQQQAKEMDKVQKTFNKSQVIEQQFQKRINGEYVSTAYSDMPTNENTGDFDRQDMVNYANNKLAEIDNMDVPDAKKDQLKLQYLRADTKDGPFRTAIGTMVTDANQEWSAAVINGKMPESTPAMDSLRRIRNADPNLVAALYPEQAELFTMMDLMDKQGVDTQILIDGTKQVRSRTKEMQYEDDRAWQALKNDSTAPELSRLPTSMDKYARTMYDAIKYATGNESLAMAQTQKFLQESTVTLSSDDVEGKTLGVLPKNILQVNDDPASWEEGRKILDAAREGIIKHNPWITNSQLTVYQQGDSIYMMDTTGQVRIRYDKEILQREWRNMQERIGKEQAEEALKAATKRAPIAAATQARKAAAERVKEKRKRTPKYIYGRKE